MNIDTGTPFFLDVSARRLFVVFLTANPDVDFQGAVLHCPAFGEEMNKSRAMVLCQARALTEQGYSVLVPDYFGTGDSYGDFCQASWTIWLEDMTACLAWLQQQAPAEITLWGLRLGGLMALELASQTTTAIARLVLWNPVLQGEQYMLQFLRLRLVNSLMQGERKEKVADLTALIEQQGVIEVAGYELSRAMFTEVSARKAQTLAAELNSAIEVLWLDVAAQLKTLPVPTQKLVDQLAEAGHKVTVKQLVGPQFWATQEISRADTLIATTSECLSSQHCQAQASF